MHVHAHVVCTRACIFAHCFQENQCRIVVPMRNSSSDSKMEVVFLKTTMEGDCVVRSTTIRVAAHSILGRLKLSWNVVRRWEISQ